MCILIVVLFHRIIVQERKAKNGFHCTVCGRRSRDVDPHSHDLVACGGQQAELARVSVDMQFCSLEHVEHSWHRAAARGDCASHPAGHGKMNGHRANSAPKSRSPWVFFLVVFLMSVLIWVAGPVAEQFLAQDKPVDLPLSSLMAFCPISAVLILVKRQSGSGGVKTLLRRAFDWRIKRRIWYLPILFLMPVIIVLQRGLIDPMRVPSSDPQVSVLTTLVFVVVFFIAAVSEEVGWQGYAIDLLQDRWNALTASIVLGMVWAIWHIVPLIQLGRTPTQIVWQCMDMVATRILIVWLYNNTGRSLFATVLYHMMYNVSTLLLPNYGLHYDPFVTSILVAIVAVAVTFLWGPKTLARYRYSRSDQDVQSRAGDVEIGLADRET